MDGQTTHTCAHVTEDSKRFQAWQLAALAERPAGTDLLSIGPFRAVVPAADRPGAWVTIVEGTAGEPETRDAVAGLRSVFRQRNAELEIEYDEAIYPEVAPWLEAAGLALAERNPLMACRPEVFNPSIAPHVVLRRLTSASNATDLQAFQTIRWTNGGDKNGEVPAADTLRRDLASTTSVYLLAWLEGEAAGTGVSHALKGVIEIVGVVTRSDKRRQGIATTVTSNLVARHFAAGGDFAFLDAANEEAARVYERLGFRRFGENLVYRERDGDR